MSLKKPGGRYDQKDAIRQRAGDPTSETAATMAVLQYQKILREETEEDEPQYSGDCAAPDFADCSPAPRRGLSPISQREAAHHLFARLRTLPTKHPIGFGFSSKFSISPPPAILDYGLICQIFMKFRGPKTQINILDGPVFGVWVRVPILLVQNSHPAFEIGEARVGSQGIKLGINA